MSFLVKCKITREIFKNNGYYILACVPYHPYNEELELNNYGNFTICGELSFLDVNKEYELEIEAKSRDKYGVSYKVISVPSVKIDLDNLSYDDSFEMLMSVTSSERIANNIITAYPDFIKLVLENRDDEIDLKKIKGVGDVYYSAYKRMLNEKYKYLAFMNKYKQFQLEVNDCKVLFNNLYTEENIMYNLKEKPYYVLIELLNRSFAKADKLLTEIDPSLIDSDQRCEALIMEVLKRNEVDGSSRLNGSMLFRVVKEEYNADMLIPKLKDVAVNSELIYFDEASKDLSLMSTYIAETTIVDFFYSKLANSTQLEVEDIKKYQDVDGFKITDTQLSALDNLCKYNVSLLIGYSGSGKAQPIDTVIPTPIGNRKLGDIKVGDYVLDRFGKPTKVLGVYPQGMKDTYTVTLSDGRTTQCNDEHLWSYYTSKGNLATKTLREMIDSGMKNGSINKYKIPTNEAVQYEEKELPLDPYVLGSFIGNGCCKNRPLTLSSNDFEQVNNVATILNCKPKKPTDKNYNWVFEKEEHTYNKFGKEVKYIQTKDILPNEICCESYKKQIPNEYKYGSIEQRYALLQGLFDTDGYINNIAPRFSLNYTTTSEALAKDISEILYSLGYSCSISKDERYLHRDNIKNGHPCYQINVLCDNDEKEKFFRLSRKKDRALEAKNYKKRRNYNHISIVDVKKEEYQSEMVCIYVDNDEHLYLTNDYIVTHNTSSTKAMISMLDDLGMTYTLVSPTGKASQVFSEATNRKASTIHKKCAEKEINSDVLIVDECSMISLDVFSMLINAIVNENMRIVLVGDSAQLCPIGLGKIFSDLITSNKIPMTMLTEIFRYRSNGSLFVATNLRQGKSFFDEDIVNFDNIDTYSVSSNYKFINVPQEDVFDRVLKEYKNLLDKKIKREDIQIYSPFNVGSAGTYIINNTIQAEFNPPQPNELTQTRRIGNTNITFRLNDLVINKKNDYSVLTYDGYLTLQEDDVLSEDDVEKASVFNGQMGIIREVLKDGLVIQFDEQLLFFNKLKVNDLLLGYCISTHSSQGSSIPYSISVVSKQHMRLLSKELLYVADTRCRKSHIDIGDIDAFNQALTISADQRRNTWLLDLLEEKFN